MWFRSERGQRGQLGSCSGTSGLGAADFSPGCRVPGRRVVRTRDATTGNVLAVLSATFLGLNTVITRMLAVPARRKS